MFYTIEAYAILWELDLHDWICIVVSGPSKLHSIIAFLPQITLLSYTIFSKTFIWRHNFAMLTLWAHRSGSFAKCESLGILHGT